MLSLHTPHQLLVRCCMPRIPAHFARSPPAAFARTQQQQVRSMMNKSVNRSGHPAEVTKNLPTRQPADASEADLLKKLRQLYSSDATQLSTDTYSFLKDDAVFHDPVGFAEGKTHIQEQFNGLAKIFSKSTYDRQDLLQNPEGVPASTMLVNQDVTYYRGESPFKTLNSLVTLERASDGKVQRFQEEWNHQGEPERSDGFFGYLSELRKRLTVNATGAFIDPKPPADH